MSVYVSNIAAAAAAFPLIALLITLPYMVSQYRKLGSVPWLSTIAVYSFVFYLLCAYFLVLLPLPEDRTAVVPYAQTPQLVPFNFVREFLAETPASIHDASTWPGVIRDPYVYEAVFNVALLVPLGMYLRYYFRRTWAQTLAIGFCVTLSFELTQLTGLWGVYAHPYRLFDVDDLMMNTLGAMTGYWLAGPLMRVLPDVRLVRAEARERGTRASVTRRALSFGIDCALVGAVGLALAVAWSALAPDAAGDLGNVRRGALAAAWALVLVACPIATHGRTPGQALLKLRIVRPDARDAAWYQILARYGLLALFIVAPLALLSGVSTAGGETDEATAFASFVADNRPLFLTLWAALAATWALSLLARAARAARGKETFTMLNGLISNTTIMSETGVARERERGRVLTLDQIAALERQISAEGVPLAELMARAGAACAEEVRAWVPDPSRVCVLAGSGNNGGDGWVCALELARAGYDVTLVTAKMAEDIKAEPARQTAIDVFADAAANRLPLRVLVDPGPDVVERAVDEAACVVDAVLGTGFSGVEVREPYAGWLRAANRRRFGGVRGAHRLGADGGGIEGLARGGGKHRAGSTPLRKVHGAPFALAVDAPSGMSAQTGSCAVPCFYADATVTMLAYKPGLMGSCAAVHAGAVKLAPLVDDIAERTARVLEENGNRDGTQGRQAR